MERVGDALDIYFGYLTARIAGGAHRPSSIWGLQA